MKKYQWFILGSHLLDSIKQIKNIYISTLLIVTMKCKYGYILYINLYNFILLISHFVCLFIIFISIPARDYSWKWNNSCYWLQNNGLCSSSKEVSSCLSCSFFKSWSTWFFQGNQNGLLFVSYNHQISVQGSGGHCESLKCLAQDSGL